MVKLLLLFSLFLLYHSETGVIYWENSRYLSWRDFKAHPLSGTKHIAKSACGISIKRSNNKNGYIIKAYFIPERSWYIKNKISENTLRHEQLHFDIAELFACKMKKHFLKVNLSFENIKHDFDSLFLTYEQFQQTYDKETCHGTNHTKQNNWERFVHYQMKLYKNYQ